MISTSAEAEELQPDAPLAGVRILDLTTAWAGPMATRIAAYLGADVIHIESPGRPDGFRGAVSGGPSQRYRSGDPGKRPWNRTISFNSQNINKRGIALDVKSTEGHEIMMALVAKSDALVTNFRPGTLRKMGLEYSALRKVRPEIVVLEMPGFGLTGPMAYRVALGATMEAVSGMACLTGYGDGRPVVTGPAYVDPIGAFNGATALVTGLLLARLTGVGQHIEVPQCEAAMQWIGEELLAAAGGGSAHQPDGNVVSYGEPHEAYKCEGVDEWVALSVRDDADWERLCEVIGRSDLLAPAETGSVLGRRRQRESVREAIEGWTAQRSKHEAAGVFQANGLIAAPVADGAEVAQREDLLVDGFFSELGSADVESTFYQGLGLWLERTPGTARTHAPGFGEHNDEVLRDIAGLTVAEVEELKVKGVVADRPNS